MGVVNILPWLQRHCDSQVFPFELSSYLFYASDTCAFFDAVCDTPFNKGPSFKKIHWLKLMNCHHLSLIPFSVWPWIQLKLNYLLTGTLIPTILSPSINAVLIINIAVVMINAIASTPAVKKLTFRPSTFLFILTVGLLRSNGSHSQSDDISISNHLFYRHWYGFFLLDLYYANYSFAQIHL